MNQLKTLAQKYSERANRITARAIKAGKPVTPTELRGVAYYLWAAELVTLLTRTI